MPEGGAENVYIQKKERGGTWGGKREPPCGTKSGRKEGIQVVHRFVLIFSRGATAKREKKKKGGILGRK